MGKSFALGRLRFWLGSSGWGWRLWGVSLGDAWFAGLSRRYPDTAVDSIELRVERLGVSARSMAQEFGLDPLVYDAAITFDQKDVDLLAERLRGFMAAKGAGRCGKSGALAENLDDRTDGVEHACSHGAAASDLGCKGVDGALDLGEVARERGRELDHIRHDGAGASPGGQ